MSHRVATQGREYIVNQVQKRISRHRLDRGSNIGTVPTKSGQKHISGHRRDRGSNIMTVPTKSGRLATMLSPSLPPSLSLSFSLSLSHSLSLSSFTPCTLCPSFCSPKLYFSQTPPLSYSLSLKYHCRCMNFN